MEIEYPCPSCEATNRLPVGPTAEVLACAECGQEVEVPQGAFESGRLRRCLMCPSTDLFLRKAFPQRLGVAIVVLGFAASCVAWYFYMTYLTFGILFATALVDVVLYAIVGDVLSCYRCSAIYRRVEGLQHYAAFNLETHERYRQQAARLSRHNAPTPGRGVPGG